MRIFIVTFTLLVFVSPELYSKPKCKTRVVRPCKPGSENYDKAEKNLKEIVKKTRELPEDGDPEHLYVEMKGLLNGPCFTVGHHEYLDKPSSAAALKEWMFGRNGDSWLKHFIELGQPAKEQTRGVHWLAIMPDMPSSLTLEDEPDSPLSDLVCSVAVGDCGRGTRGWKLRARRVFREFARERYKHFVGPLPEKETVSKRCKKKKRKSSSESRFENWANCVAESVLKVEEFPVGEFKVPPKGWLLIKGRRGHYKFCDSIRAYDLETGAAYVAQSCSALKLVEGGSVDMGKTDDGRVLSYRAGTLPVDNLRETVWMLLMADEIQKPEKIAVEFFPVPKKLSVQILESDCWGELGGLGSLYSSVSSAETLLAWSYMVNGVSFKSGRFTWPRTQNKASYAYAADLLRITEMAMTDNPPPAPLPKNLDFGDSVIGVSRLDATQERLIKTYDVLWESMQTFGKEK